MRCLWWRSDWILLKKSYFKKMTSGRLHVNPKNLKMFTDMDHSDTLIRQLCPRAIQRVSGRGREPPYLRLIGTGNLPSAESGRSRNVLIHLYLVNTKTTYKNFDIFYIDPLSDLRPDLARGLARYP
jgi:hypothetical protein